MNSLETPTEEENAEVNDDTNSETKSEQNIKISIPSPSSVYRGLPSPIYRKIQNKVNSTYEKDIDYSISARYTCRKTGHILEVISQLLSLGSTILAFSAGFYDDKMLSFIAGCLGSLSLATLKTSAFALKESKERTASLNKLLIKLNLGTIPEIVEDM